MGVTGAMATTYVLRPSKTRASTGAHAAIAADARSNAVSKNARRNASPSTSTSTVARGLKTGHVARAVVDDALLR